MPDMGDRITEEALIQRFADEGITVVETLEGMGDDVVAWYCKSSRTIAIHPDLLARQRVPALLHEWVHHLRGDDGPQTPAVEALIDEQVATLIVDPDAYRFAEAQLGWHTGGIAAELGVPRWVVEAVVGHSELVEDYVTVSDARIAEALAALGDALELGGG